MFDIVHNLMSYFVLIRGESTINETISTEQQSIDSAMQPEDHGAPQQPHPSEVQPQDVLVTEAHDGKMAIY
jgi:hypothetical protein